MILSIEFFVKKAGRKWSLFTEKVHCATILGVKTQKPLFGGKLKGKLKAIGVSNYLVPHLDEMLKYCTVLPSVLQVEYHPHLVQQQLLQYCTDHRIHVQAYSSLGAASGCEKLLSEPILLEIARKYSKTPAQVLLRWATQHGLSVIPKTTQPKRLEENADIFDFDLLYEDMNNLNSLDKQTHYCWDPSSIL
ncbi:uncharacterized protein LOC106478616 isoform X2 [Limulus polyphemus]|uniref:Uncharacterized protein LOC106478616 isoform X2 n=1 Tax=Limulus polyphemus TaxID=6850 RepID=A0ABM1S2U1_LIMPO|nr:uncharacterized protein LOC106478616 isoform X2 [Limulus polyphemus]